MKEDSEKAKRETNGTAALHLEGSYSDGHPLDEVQYLECKIILKADRFKSADSFREFGKLVRRTGKRELAREHLTTAMAMYREMDMRFWLEQAEAELRELG
jgi:hypothetical protein